jgi:hypothetical protein
VPVETAQLRLDLLIKINSELPGENGSRNHDFGKISAKIIRSPVAQTFAHGSPQALDTFARAFRKAQRGIGKSILAVSFPKAVGKRDDPRIGRDQRQIGVWVATENEKAVSDDLCPESTFTGSSLAQLAEDDTGRSVQQKEPTQLAWRYVDLKFDADTTGNDVGIAGRDQLDTRPRKGYARPRLLLIPDRLVLDLPTSLAEDRRGRVWIVGCKQGGKHSRDSKTQAVALLLTFPQMADFVVSRGGPFETVTQSCPDRGTLTSIWNLPQAALDSGRSCRGTRRVMAPRPFR